MRKAGAAGLLSVTPYYNKPTQEGLYQHFRAIADSTPLPIIVYNVPGRTGVNIEPPTLARLAAIPNIVGVKEASGNITQMCEICRAVPPDFLVLSGDDAMTLPLMAVGGRGVISVASNEMPAEMVADGRSGRARRLRGGARDSPRAILPLMQVNFVESNPVPVKAAMAAMGLLEEVYRLPMVPPRPESREKIRRRCSRSSDLLEGGVTRDARSTRSRTARRGRRRRPIATPPATRLRGFAKRSRPARCAPPNPTPRARSAGASTPG